MSLFTLAEAKLLTCCLLPFTSLHTLAGSHFSLLKSAYLKNVSFWNEELYSCTYSIGSVRHLNVAQRATVTAPLSDAP